MALRNLAGLSTADFIAAYEAQQPRTVPVAPAPAPRERHPAAVPEPQIVEWLAGLFPDE